MWFTLAWKWLKKYWMWLLFPVGILLYLIGRATSKETADVVAPEVVGAEEERRRLQEEADRKLLEAERARQFKLDEIRREYDEATRELTDEQRARVKELEEDPDRLNEFLLDVGKKTRG